MNKNYKEKSKSLPRPQTAKNPNRPPHNVDQISYVYIENEKNENLEQINLNQNNFGAKTLYSKNQKYFLDLNYKLIKNRFLQSPKAQNSNNSKNSSFPTKIVPLINNFQSI